VLKEKYYKKLYHKVKLEFELKPNNPIKIKNRLIKIMSANNFEYKYALVCKYVPDSIKDGLSLKKHDGIDVDKAREEHRLYLDCMKSIGLKLIEIEGKEEYPDCVFVEDCVIMINNKAFITNPGAISRRGEVQNVRKRLEEFALENFNEIKLEIGSIENKDESFIDGGDCCFTGRELLCGISSRTNVKG
jgi:dimethylargininase